MTNQTRKYNRFLVACSGEDEFIIKKCSIVIQKRFELIGFCVALIFLICFLSATFFTYSLFQDSHWVSFPMGIIWGAVVANIYLLLLYTISPSLLPVASKKGKLKMVFGKILESKFWSLSMFLRLWFMLLLAFIIAQPFNVCFLSTKIAKSLENHKIIEKTKMFVTANHLLIKEEMIALKDFNLKIINRLNSEDSLQVRTKLSQIESKIENDNLFLKQTSGLIIKYKKSDNTNFINAKNRTTRDSLVDVLDNLLNDELISDANFLSNISTISISNGTLKSDFDKYKTNLISLITKKTTNYNTLKDILNKSNFYVKSIKLLLTETKIAWFWTLIISLSFLLPIYLKFKVRTLSSSFFDKDFKDNSEMKRIRSEIVDNNDFVWLENKIKTLNLNNVKTSDYYFQRMLLEHRIILEDYEKSKSIYSKILTKHVKRFNENSQNNIKPLLNKLKKINLEKYNELKDEIDQELQDEIVTKYEFWIDAPFRTIRRNKNNSISNQETDLLHLVYDEEIGNDSEN
jgi:hypothetical protein